MKRLDALFCLLLAAPACADDGADYRYSATIEFAPAPAFVRLPLPASAYAHSRQAELRDLRILDARGQRVPFAILAPRANETMARETRHPALLYPLPAAPAADGTWQVPLEVSVEGRRVIVKHAERRGDMAGRSAGWLFDLGETHTEEPRPHALRLIWSGPSEFSAGYHIETSDDLRAWQAAGSGQVLALAGVDGPISQPLVALPTAPSRFVRLMWDDPAGAPKLAGAELLRKHPKTQHLDAPTEIILNGSRTEPDLGGKATKDKTPDDGHTLYFDLGGDLPLASLDLRFDANTQVAPARIYVRSPADAAWRLIASSVFYRFRRGTETVQAPSLDIDARARYLRIVVDPRAAPLDAAGSHLVVMARLASLVFAPEGPTPLTLHAGSDKAATGALPIASLVPDLNAERPRFGTAHLGAWRENPEATREAAIESRNATVRRLLLWGVLTAGVGMLAYMVWRQAATRPRS